MPDEEKNKRYGRNQNRSISKNDKQKLKDYTKNWYKKDFNAKVWNPNLADMGRPCQANMCGDKVSTRVM